MLKAQRGGYMAVGQMEISSEVLGRRVLFSVCLPDPAKVGSGPYPGVLQLHGRGDNHTSWVVRSKIANYAEDLPVAIIMPDGNLSYWTNWWIRGAGNEYEDFLMDELLPACEGMFALRAGRWGIGGLSMGGYGAIRLGLKYPDRFASIAAHSSVIFDREELEEQRPDLRLEERMDGDAFAHAETALANAYPPELMFDCGLSDHEHLLAGNRAFHAHLDRIGYGHCYQEHQGGHTWDYWDEHVSHALRRHVAVLT